MLCSTITCAKCGPDHQTYRWQFEYAISLSIDGRVSNLEDALAGYFRHEVIDDYTCVKCSIRRYLAMKKYEEAEGLTDEEIK